MRSAGSYSESLYARQKYSEAGETEHDTASVHFLRLGLGPAAVGLLGHLRIQALAPPLSSSVAPTALPRKSSLLTVARRDHWGRAPAYSPRFSFSPTQHHHTPVTLAFGNGARLSPTSNPFRLLTRLLTLPKGLRPQLFTPVVASSFFGS